MRLAALTAGLFLGLTGLASAQTFDTPQALLEAFYAPYFSGEFTEDESPFFSEELEALYAADAEATPEGEIGALDFDPFVDGQDFELTDFVIGAPGMAGEFYGYDGPCPPWNDERVHHYVFTLYALDMPRLPLTGRFTGLEARMAIYGHILDEACIFGTYALNPHAVADLPK